MPGTYKVPLCDDILYLNLATGPDVSDPARLGSPGCHQPWRTEPLLSCQEPSLGVRGWAQTLALAMVRFSIPGRRPECGSLCPGHPGPGLCLGLGPGVGGPRAGELVCLTLPWSLETRVLVQSSLHLAA